MNAAVCPCPVQLEMVHHGKLYRLTPYSVREWYSIVRQGCPCPAVEVDEYERVWENVRL